MTAKTINKKVRETNDVEEIKKLLLNGVLDKLQKHIENTEFLTLHGKTVYYAKEIEKDNKQLVCDQYFTRLLQKLARELFKELSEECKNTILNSDININKTTTLYILKQYKIVYRPIN